MKCKGVCDKCKELDGQRHVHDFIPDLDITAGYDRASRDHTSLPVPSQLTVRPSSIPGAGLGVFANTFISSNVRVGKFKGKIVTGEQMKDCDTAYAWEVSGENTNDCYLVDGKDPDRANWLRFVNCARYSEEQNLIAYQYDQNIYYRTIRHIYGNEELLVWYGDDYAKELGLRTTGASEDELDCQCCGDFISKETKDAFLEGDKMRYGLGREGRCGERKKHMTRSVRTRSRETHSGLRPTVKKLKPTDCPECNKSFSLSSIGRHMLSHSKVRRFGCKICKKRFKRSDHLKVHMSSVHAGCQSENGVHHLHKCKDNTMCGLKHKRSCQSLLNDPVPSVTLNKSSSVSGSLDLIRCVWCLNVFSSPESLKSHIALVHKPFKCELCDERFSTKELLSHHFADHRNRGPCQCSACGKVYSRMDTLRRHVRQYCDSTKLVSFRCKFCGKNFNHHNSLTSHLRKFVCRYRHSRTARNAQSRGGAADSEPDGKVRRVKLCRLCKRTFSANTPLSTHMLTHLSNELKAKHSRQELTDKLHVMFREREYKCSHCTACFTKRLSLHLHQRVHTGRPKFRCEYCNLLFGDFRSLNAHLASHKDEKRRCQFCDFTSSMMSNLVVHVKNLHCKKVSCHLCPKEYDTKMGLSNHLRRSHGVITSRCPPLKAESLALKDFSINISPLPIAYKS